MGERETAFLVSSGSENQNDANNMNGPPPTDTDGIESWNATGEAEKRKRDVLFAQIFGSVTGGIDTDFDSLSDCNDCLSGSDTENPRPNNLRPHSSLNQQRDHSTRRGSLQNQKVKENYTAPTKITTTATTASSRKDSDSTVPTNLFNPFKLLARSPQDGTFGISFLANGLNHASAITAATSAQSEWEDICNDWAAIVSAIPAVVEPHRLPGAIDFAHDENFSAELLRIDPDLGFRSINTEVPPALTLSLALVAPPPPPPPTFLSEDNCAACLGRGILLCCDSCPKVFHFCCVAEGFSGDGLDTPNLWECNVCRWKNTHDVDDSKSIKTTKRTKSSSPVPQPTVTNTVEKIKSAFNFLNSAVESHNPRSFQLPNHIWMSYACVYKHPLTGDYIDLIQTEVTEVTAPAPNNAAPPLTRRNNLAFLAQSTANSTANTNVIHPTTAAFSAISSAEWTQTVIRIKGTVADWVHDAQYSQFNTPQFSLKQKPAAIAAMKPKNSVNTHILTTLATHTRLPYTRNLPFCHACALSSRRDMVKCDHCDAWWHPECLPLSFTHRPPLNRPITSAVLSNGGVSGGTVGHARTPPPVRDFAATDCVDAAFAWDLQRRCWGDTWMERDDTTAYGSVYFRKRWMCPLHVDWAVSDAHAAGKLRRRKRKQVIVVDYTDIGEKVVTGKVVDMENVLKGNDDESGVGGRWNLVLDNKSGGGVDVDGNVLGLDGDRVGDDGAYLLIVNVEDHPVLSDNETARFDWQDGTVKPDDSNVRQQTTELLENRKIRIKGDPSVLAMAAAKGFQINDNENDGIVVQIPVKLNPFQKSFGVGKGITKAKRKSTAAAAFIASLQKNNDQLAITSENIKKSGNGIEDASNNFKHGNKIMELQVTIDDEGNQNHSDNNDEAVAIVGQSKVAGKSGENQSSIVSVLEDEVSEMIHTTSPQSTIYDDNDQKGTTVPQIVLNTKNSSGNEVSLEKIDKLVVFNLNETGNERPNANAKTLVTAGPSLNSFGYLNETQLTVSAVKTGVRGRGRPRKFDTRFLSFPLTSLPTTTTTTVKTLMAYMCPEPGCEKGYPERWRLKSHMMLHTNKFLCTLENCMCGNKPFQSFYHLDRHQKKVLHGTVVAGGLRKNSRAVSANSGGRSDSPKRGKEPVTIAEHESENGERSGLLIGSLANNTHTATAAETAMKLMQLQQKNASAYIEPTENVFYCTFAGCGKNFTSLGFLQRHFHKIHRMPVSVADFVDVDLTGVDSMFYCDSCNKTLVSRKSLIRHKGLVHNIPIADIHPVSSNVDKLTQRNIENTRSNGADFATYAVAIDEAESFNMSAPIGFQELKVAAVIPAKDQPKPEKKYTCHFANCGWKFSSKWNMHKHLNAHANGRYRDLEKGIKPVSAYVRRSKKLNVGGPNGIDVKKLGRNGVVVGSGVGSTAGSSKGHSGPMLASSATATATVAGDNARVGAGNFIIPYKFPVALRKIVYLFGARKFKGRRNLTHCVPNKTFRVDFGGHVLFVDSVDDEWLDLKDDNESFLRNGEDDSALSILMDAFQQIAALEERTDLEREIIYKMLELK